MVLQVQPVLKVHEVCKVVSVELVNKVDNAKKKTPPVLKVHVADKAQAENLAHKVHPVLQALPAIKVHEVKTVFQATTVQLALPAQPVTLVL